MNAHAASTRNRSGYPGKVAIRHAIEAAKACGLDVGGYEVAPDGTIRIFDARSLPKSKPDLYERWEDKL